jgi:cytoskeletal protein RodZ
LPPPFPVVAPPATGRTTPPIPHIKASTEPSLEETPAPGAKSKPRRARKGVLFGSLAAVLLLGGGAYFAWPMLFPPPPPPPPVAVKPKPAAPAANVATTPAQNAAPVTSSAATKPASAAPAPAPGVLDTIAHAPVNAINKATDAVTARRKSEQSRIDAMAEGKDAPDKPASGTPAPATKPGVSASATLAPGVSATTSDVDAVADSTPAFRAFVANAKITGVIGGTPPKIILNGRMARAGDIVDPGLGVTFENVDAEKKLLVFRDRTGAIVTKKF